MQLSLKPEAPPVTPVKFTKEQHPLLERIARLSWFPRADSVTGIALDETLSGLIEALLTGYPKYFKDICDAISQIHR